MLWDIESDPALAGTKLIAEAWDAGGLYQVGSFVGNAWREWNGKFRDDVRRFLRGDEGRRTQQGNNNAYCHDSEISWFDWSLVEKHAGLRRFVKLLLACRLDPERDMADRDATLVETIDASQLKWHGVKVGGPDWGPHSHSLAVTARPPRLSAVMHRMLNAYWEPLDFELPPVPAEIQGPWRRWLDTSLESPDDIGDWRNGPAVSETHYRVQPRSLVVLMLPENDNRVKRTER